LREEDKEKEHREKEKEQTKKEKVWRLLLLLLLLIQYLHLLLHLREWPACSTRWAPPVAPVHARGSLKCQLIQGVLLPHASLAPLRHRRWAPSRCRQHRRASLSSSTASYGAGRGGVSSIERRTLVAGDQQRAPKFSQERVCHNQCSGHDRLALDSVRP